MKLRPSKPFAQRLTVGAAVCAVVLLWLCAASVFVNPLYCRYLGVVGLAFPFFLAGVLVMTAVTLVVAPRRVWIPLVGLGLAFFSIRDYCPLNFPTDPPKGSIKVLSFNTESFGTGKKDSAGRNAICAYIVGQRPDIACLQEANILPEAFENDVLPLMRSVFPHYDTLNLSSNVLACFSRYRIVKKELICQGTTNGSGAFTLVRRPGDTILVVNCHLESMHLSNDDRQQYHTLVRDPERSDVEGSSRMLISKISNAAKIRSVQATKTANFIKRHAGKSIILCGDFNDTPISFTHHRIVSAGLTDAYVATGRGIGRSFNRDAIYVRIDNIMCSDDWKPYACHIDHSFKGSDHYPIVAYLKKKK